MPPAVRLTACNGILRRNVLLIRRNKLRSVVVSVGQHIVQHHFHALGVCIVLLPLVVDDGVKGCLDVGIGHAAIQQRSNAGRCAALISPGIGLPVLTRGGLCLAALHGSVQLGQHGFRSALVIRVKLRMVILESIDAPVRDLFRSPLVDVLGGVDLEKPAVCIHADCARHVPGIRLLCLHIGQLVHANTLSAKQDVLQSDGLRFRCRHTVICARTALCGVFCRTHGITLRIHLHVSCWCILRNTWVSFTISCVRVLFPADSGNAADDRGNEGVVTDVLRRRLVCLVTEENLLNGDVRQVLCRLLHSLTQAALDHGPG